MHTGVISLSGLFRISCYPNGNHQPGAGRFDSAGCRTNATAFVCLSARAPRPGSSWLVPDRQPDNRGCNRVGQDCVMHRVFGKHQALLVLVWSNADDLTGIAELIDAGCISSIVEDT